MWLAVRLLPKYGLDGSFDKETDDAVRFFQSENHDANGAPLTVDGMVGRVTLGALDAAVLPPPARPDEMLTVTVDVVVFPDGPSAKRLPRILREANYVFNRAGIRVELVTVWTGQERAGRLQHLRGQSRKPA